MRQPSRSVLYALVICTCLRSTQAAVIAVGNLQTCINNGTDSLECAKKIIVTLTLENNKLYQTDQLQFEVACVDSPTGRCPCPCFHKEDPSCACRDLRRSIKVSVTKTPVYAVYPLSQPRMFNGRPYEEYITTGAGGSAGGNCMDSEANKDPTCGWARAPDASGALHDVPDSQGLCCQCPTLGGDPIRRGYRDCSWKTSWLGGGVAGSAHCLRYDDYWWYRGYVIGQYQLEFDIQVHINTSDLAPPPGTDAPEDLYPAPVEAQTEILSVNPSRMTALSSRRTVAARLLGDLASYRQIQVLDGHWMMVPVEPGLSPNEIFTSNLDMWAVFPPYLVTTTGECNKIGVDYTAFRYQPSACGQPLGSCLRNQIYELGEADTQRIAAGQEPLYNITRYGGGQRNSRQVAATQDGGGLSLRLPLKGVRTSLVLLEVAADDVQLVVNKAPGKIIVSEVCTFDRTVCGGFQAIAARGFLRAMVQNVGLVAADFRASVTDCSAGVLPVQEEFASIAAGATHNFTFDLMMETDLAGNRSCTLIVTDSVGDIADSTQVQFYTNATTYDPPPDQSDLGDKPVRPGDPPKYPTCASMCPNLFNLKCLLLRGCWSRLAQAVMTMVLLAAVFTVLWLALRRGWIKRCATCLGCCGGKGGRRERDRSAEAGPTQAMPQGSLDEEVACPPLKKHPSAVRKQGPIAGPSTSFGSSDKAKMTAYYQHQVALAQQPEELIGAGHYAPPPPLQLPRDQPVRVPLTSLETQRQRWRQAEADSKRWVAADTMLYSNPLAAAGDGAAERLELRRLETPSALEEDPGEEIEVRGGGDGLDEEGSVADLAMTVGPREGP